MNEPHRAGRVAIVGRANVGKSTLLNHLVGQKISITSRKPQTTRLRITGILTREDAQLVFVDTPGFQTHRNTALSRLMNRNVTASLEEVDVVVIVVEALRIEKEDKALLGLVPRRVPLVAAVNKVDRVRERSLLLPFFAKLQESRNFAAIIPVSALRGTGLDDLARTLAALVPVGPPMFDEDEITSLSERFLAAELVREKVIRLLGEELPYAAAVDIARFETRGALRRIYAEIVVDKVSQKPIVIGKSGEKLKRIATQARQDMERLFGGKVYLEVWVKVKKGWADDARALRRMGYGA